jgi:cation diffusion facilitator CzcD-associated flavoprotein CzcO
VTPHSRRIAIIGAGPGGICAGIKLLEAGFHDIVVIDRAPRVGGTWHHNRYPGAECDVM